MPMPKSPRLAALERQFSEVTAAIDTIERAASANGGTLTDDQAAQLETLFDRAEGLKPEIEALGAQAASIQATADVLAAVNGTAGPAPIDRASGRPEPPELTAGEYLAEFYRAYHPSGSSVPDEFLERAARYLDASIDRATQTTADTAGILPTPIVGQVVKLSDSLRPVFASLSARPMPAKGKTFERPRVTQRVAVGTQTEGQTAASQAMVLDSDTVTKATQAGTLDLTAQDIDWTEPAALQLVVNDFVEMYAEWTEGLACDFVESLIVTGDAAVGGSTYSPYDSTDVGTLVTSYVNAFIAVYNKAKRFPDRMWQDLASAAALVTTRNSDDTKSAATLIREALQEMGVGPVAWVTGPQFAADTRVLGCSSLVESYESQKGLLRAEVPSSLKTTIAYAGYTAFWGRHEGVIQLGPDPSP